MVADSVEAKMDKLLEEHNADYGVYVSGEKTVVIPKESNYPNQEKICTLLNQNISNSQIVIICTDTKENAIYSRLAEGFNSFVCFPIKPEGAVFLGFREKNLKLKEKSPKLKEENWQDLSFDLCKNQPKKNIELYSSGSIDNFINGGLSIEGTSIKIWGYSSSLQKNVFEKIKRYRDVNRVLIYGETGVGKELVAQALHALSNRKGEFVSVNCKTLGGDSNIQLLELFGCQEGWVNGLKKRDGYFKQANNGTLFLDEINSLNLDSQGLILRALQENKITVCGAEKAIDIDLKIVCAANELLLNSKFRSDLYYRISTCIIEIPPLRKREKNDYTMIIRQELKDLNRKEKKEFEKRNKQQLKKLNEKGRLKEEDEKRRKLLEKAEWVDIDIQDSTINIIKKYEYEWPGNIRELKSFTEKAFKHSLGKPKITKEVVLEILEQIKAEHTQSKINKCKFDIGEEKKISFEMKSSFKNIGKLKEEIYKKAYEWKKSNPNIMQKDIAKILGVSDQQICDKFKSINLEENKEE